MTAQQTSTIQERKYAHRKRWAIFITGAIIFTVGIVTWLLSSERIILNDWSYVLSGLFTLCGIILTLLAWLFPLQPIEPVMRDANRDVKMTLPSTSVSHTHPFRQATALPASQQTQEYWINIGNTHQKDNRY